jgi:hypothetical protein
LLALCLLPVQLLKLSLLSVTVGSIGADGSIGVNPEMPG